MYRDTLAKRERSGGEELLEEMREIKRTLTALLNATIKLTETVQALQLTVESLKTGSTLPLLPAQATPADGAASPPEAALPSFAVDNPWLSLLAQKKVS
ncbi:MAG: hypothetical protein QXZ31_05720 [Thermofilaceae archaeon]